MKTVNRFVAQVGGITRLDDSGKLQRLAGYAIVECSLVKHKGESYISLSLRIFYPMLIKGIIYDGVEMLQDIKRPQILVA